MPAWLTLTFLALFSWGVWAILSKLLGAALSAEQSQVLSTLGMLPLLAPLALSKRSTLKGASRRGLCLAFIGGTVTCLGNIAYYAAVGRGEKVATVVSLTALYPLVTVLLAVLLLRERLNPIQLAGLCFSLAAIWLFNVQDGSTVLSPTVVYALPPILLWGLSAFFQKAATNYLSAETAALVYLAAFLPVGMFYAVIEPWPVDLSARGWLLVLALGFFLAFGNVAFLIAYACGGKAAVITPLGGLYPVVSVPIAVVLFKESIGVREGVGIILALASVGAMSWETPPAKPAVLQ